jgi:thiol-disulfide isomerase/thioredoxin
MMFSIERLAIRIAFWAMAAWLIAGPAAAQEAPKNFAMHDAARPVATIKFDDGQGQSRSLADFKGKVVLLNIWATWCVPCRKEMPALDRLQALLGGADFEVVPISIDRGGIETVGKFYAEISLQNLAMYIDSSGQMLRALGAVGLPTTLLIDRGGNEIGRIVGPAAWDAPEIVEFLRSIMLKRDDGIGGLAQEARNPAPQNDDAPSGLLRGFQWLKALVIK